MKYELYRKESVVNIRQQTSVVFGRTGNAERFQVRGWSAPEDNYTFCIDFES